RPVQPSERSLRIQEDCQGKRSLPQEKEVFRRGSPVYVLAAPFCWVCLRTRGPPGLKVFQVSVLQLQFASSSRSGALDLKANDDPIARVLHVACAREIIPSNFANTGLDARR